MYTGENWMSGICHQYPQYPWQEDLNWFSVETTRLLTVELLILYSYKRIVAIYKYIQLICPLCCPLYCLL